MNLNPIQQNLDAENLNQGTSKAVPATTPAASPQIEFPKEKPISDEQKTIMLYYGYNPNDPNDIAKWNALSSKEKEGMQNMYYVAKEANRPGVKPLEVKPLDNEISGDTVSQTVRDSVKKQSMITLPDNWETLSASKKQKFVMDQLGQKMYGSEWDKKNIIEKNKIIATEFEKIARELDPQFDNYIKSSQSKELKKLTIDLAVVLNQFQNNAEISKEDLMQSLKQLRNISAEERYEARLDVAQQFDEEVQNRQQKREEYEAGLLKY